MVERMDNWRRTHMCGTLSTKNIGEDVVLMGWVQKRRDLGGLIFVDLRDRTGLVQLNFDPSLPSEIFAKGEKLRSEYVIAVKGNVNNRPEGQENEGMKTGQVEVVVADVKILSEAATTPFYIAPDVQADESLRLRYRYLDLRRPDIQEALAKRHQITMVIRNFLDRNGFCEIETPILTKSTPEGARDYLVPSRVNEGQFYALPQSPQLFKQLLMVAGYDRYFQIARCFRDEDLRADRQPEFTQVDIEMSFVDEQDVQELGESLVKTLFKEVLGINLGEEKFLRLTYNEAMRRFGSDKPDMRFDMELMDLSDIVASSEFKVFAGAVQNGGQVKGIKVKRGAAFTRRQIDELTAYVKKFGAKGLAWISVREESIKSPIAKFLKESELSNIIDRMDATVEDLILIVADTPQVVARALGELRLHLGRELELIDQSQWKFLWVVDFPLLEYDSGGERYVAAHHPFTMPKEEDVPLLIENPAAVCAKAYDMVLNGVEIGGGSIRISDPDIQAKMFDAIGFTPEEAQRQFGFFLEALKYGTPPHGGIAFGLDRLVMEMINRHNIRDVIAFPKTTSATCLMTNAPSAVDESQLAELKIKVLD